MMEQTGKTLYLCGAGNHEGVRLALTLNRAQGYWERIVLLDDDPNKQGGAVLGVEILGPFSLLKNVKAGLSEIANLVTRSSVKRWLAWGKLKQYGLPFATLIHPNVDVYGAEIGKGVTVYQNAIVGPGAVVGEGSVIHVGAVAGHGCLLGRCCILAPNGVANARVILGDGTYLGTNAAIMPEVNVGAWATIGSCSSVICNVPVGVTVLGVPSKIVMTLKQKLASDKDENLPPDVRSELTRQLQRIIDDGAS